MKINRLLGTQSICRKNLLSFNYRWIKDNLDTIRQDGEGLENRTMEEQKLDTLLKFDFIPESYTLPEDRAELVLRMKSSDHLWIVKV